MDPSIVGEFGMKSGGEQVSLPHRHGPPVFEDGQDFHASTDAYYHRSPNENAVVWLGIQRGNLERLFKTVDLAAKGVAPDANVHQAQGNRVLFRDFVGQHDHSGASSPDGPTLRCHALYGFSEIVDGHQAAQRSAFAAWNNQPVKTCQMLWQSHFPRLEADLAENSNVLRKIALYR